MYSGIAYATVCHDGAGNAVKREGAYLDDLDDVYLPLSDFIERSELDAVMNEALERPIEGHYARDMDETELTWEIRAYFLLTVLNCQ